MYFQEIMYRAVEEPLDVNLLFPSQGKSIESQGRADISKDRFHRGESLVIDETTLHRIDLLFHLLGEALGFSLEEVDLSCL